MHTKQPNVFINEYLYGQPLYPVSPLSWLAPWWSFLCGVAASAAWSWTAGHVLRLLVGLLLAGPLLGTAWAASTQTRWREQVTDDPPGSAPHEPLLALPYTLSGSASHSLATRLSTVWGQWQQAEPRLGKSLLQLTGSTVFALTIAAQLGLPCLALTAIGLGVAYIGGLGRRRWAAHPLVAIAAPLLIAWLLGLATYGALRPQPLLAGAAFSLSFYGSSVLSQTVGTVASGLTWQVAPWAGVIAAVVAVKQPLVAAVVAILGTSQLLLAPLLETQHGRQQYFRAVQLQLAISMLLSALALGYTR